MICAILSWVGLVVLILLDAVVLTVLLPAPYRWRYAVNQRFARIMLVWLRITCRLDYRVRGLENLPREPVVILSKHQSTWETIALQALLPPQVWVLKRELMWIPVFGWLLFALHPIAINRAKGKNAMRQVKEQGRKRLAEGLNVVIFPEGTRTAWGSQPRYKLGGAVLAVEAGVPVVPVAHNAGYFWPRHAWRKKPGVVDLVIGPPIDTRGKSAEAVLDAARGWIEDTVATLTPETR